MLVKNVKGTSDNELPSGYSSWINYWQSKQNKLNVKPFCRKCKETADVGGHVIKAAAYQSKEWHIVPLCHTCNKSDESFEVAANDLVKIS